jgi:hypothetical protein
MLSQAGGGEFRARQKAKLAGRGQMDESHTAVICRTTKCQQQTYDCRELN